MTAQNTQFSPSEPREKVETKSEEVDLNEEIEKLLKEIPTTETRRRLKKMLESGSLAALSRINENDLTAYNAVMNLIAKWRPDVDLEGYVCGESEGNYNDPEEISRDIIAIDTLNAEVGVLKGKMEAHAEAAKIDISVAKSQLRTALRKLKKGKFKKTLTGKEIDEMSVANVHYIDSIEHWATVNELSKMLTSAYFGARRVAETLQDRMKTLLSEWGHECHGDSTC